MSQAVSETIDPDGRRVVLDEDGWTHIKQSHPNLAHHLREVMAAIIEPDKRISGPRPGEEWFYRVDVGRSAWIRVVVHYEHDRGLVVTAFPRRRFP